VNFEPFEGKNADIAVAMASIINADMAQNLPNESINLGLTEYLGITKMETSKVLATL